MAKHPSQLSGVSRRCDSRSDRDVVTQVTDALARADQAAPENFDYTLHEDLNPTVLRMLANHEHTGWEFSFDARGHEVRVTSEGGVFVDGVRCEASE